MMYHYTCEHGHAGLGDGGWTLPNWNPIIGAHLTWFTDMDTPDRDTLGLTSETGLLSCDRLTYRYKTVHPTGDGDIYPWLNSSEQAQTSPHTQADMQRFGDPARWFIARRQVEVALDGAYRKKGRR